ncbi:MAG: protein kinase, partial [Planctomycetes bacterium]|nr:protein kinase [Planctomycetota bacterium]
GMGDVYRGYDESLDRSVAIKVLPQTLARDKEFVQRFHAEAASAAKVDHPRVVPVYYSGEDEGHHFFAMQYIEGESLGQRLAREPRLPPEEVVRLLTQCLTGLQAAHDAGLIHRDVKPGNILIDGKTGRAVLVDFGLVRRTDQSQQITATGTVMGTVDYIAPEQAQGQPVDARADIYSLGVLTYRMLAGRLPFTADTPTAMLYQHVHEQPFPLAEAAPSVPAALVRIVERMMSKPPEERYASCAAVLADVRAFAQGKQALPEAVPVGERPTEAFESHPASSKAGLPGRLVWILGGIGLLLVVLMFYMSRGGGKALVENRPPARPIPTQPGYKPPARPTPTQPEYKPPARPTPTQPSTPPETVEPVFIGPIRGTVYDDQNGNNRRDPGEPPLPEYTVRWQQLDMASQPIQTFTNPKPKRDDRFGESISASGNRVLIGAPAITTPRVLHSGAAFLFDRETGELLHTFDNPTPANKDSFGESVALVGETVAIGAVGDNAGEDNTGSAYLFDGHSGQLTHSIHNPSSDFDDRFANVLAAGGGELLIGCCKDDLGAGNSGAAYLVDVGSGKIVHALSNPEPKEFDWFGNSVAVGGGRILVGVHYDDAAGHDTGLAYIFDAQTKTLLHTIKNAVPQSYDGFSDAVAISARHVLIGAPGRYREGKRLGEAHVFDPRTAELRFTLRNPEYPRDDLFGGSVTILDDLLVIGSPARGKVHVFDGITSRWLHTLATPNGVKKVAFGFALAAVDEEYLLVGAPIVDPRSAGTGAAHLYRFAQQTIVTDSQGNYTVDKLPPGKYRVCAKSTGEGQQPALSSSVRVFTIGADRRPGPFDLAGKQSAATRAAPEGPLYRGAVLLMTFEPETHINGTGRPRVADLSGEGNEGIVFWATPTEEGKVGSAYQFDSYDDYISLPTLREDLIADLTEFSFSAWIQRESQGGIVDFIFDCGAFPARGLSAFVLGSGGDELLGFGLPTRSGGKQAVAPKTKHRQWQHIAGVWDGHEQRFYVDGQLVAAETPEPMVLDNDSIGREPFRLGGQAQSLNRHGRYFQGLIDEVAIFNRAISYDEIRTLYQMGIDGVPLGEEREPSETSSLPPED